MDTVTIRDTKQRARHFTESMHIDKSCQDTEIEAYRVLNSSLVADDDIAQDTLDFYVRVNQLLHGTQPIGDSELLDELMRIRVMHRDMRDHIKMSGSVLVGKYCSIGTIQYCKDVRRKVSVTLGDVFGDMTKLDHRRF